MIKTIEALIKFIPNPVLEKDSNVSFTYRSKVLLSLIIISFISTFCITIFISFIEIAGLVETGRHSIEEIFKDKNSSNLKIFLIAVIGAPLIEELIFRAPLTLFKNPKYFKYAFYGFTLVFGYLHIFNYQDFNTSILIFSPILIAPQLVVGLYLGFIRIKFGLLWSIALHAMYNGVLMSLFLLVKDAITQV